METNRAEQFINNFSKAMDTMYEHAPKDLSIAISIYVRDPNNRTKEQPDGVMMMDSVYRGWYFDSMHFKEYVNQFYSSFGSRN